jgi:hypothetical protein
MNKANDAIDGVAELGKQLCSAKNEQANATNRGLVDFGRA